MAKTVVAENLWAVVAPLVAPARARPNGGRPPIPDQAAMASTPVRYSAAGPA